MSFPSTLATLTCLPPLITFLHHSSFRSHLRCHLFQEAFPDCTPSLKSDLALPTLHHMILSMSQILHQSQCVALYSLADFLVDKSTINFVKAGAPSVLFTIGSQHLA